MPVSFSYPELKKRYETLIYDKRMVTGPYIEAIPDFKKGITLKNMLIQNNGCLHNHFENMPEGILNRKLHKHQEEAIRLADEGKSLIVATGTGSGKTETFLYSIVNKLLKEGNLSNPGVRALIIYPMNALANDQLYYRIAPLIGNYLKGTGITFGRYTSDIKAGEKRTEIINKLLQNNKLMDALCGTIPVDNWMLTREEMLTNAPQILITNYAMLEHILLLPKNSGLFSNSKLNTIVLDEIHSYSGAQATEVAYLLRKLKNRLGIKERIQVFGTSASLASGEAADKNLIKFAGDLFGEKVDIVVRGERIPNTRLSDGNAHRFTLGKEQWIEIGSFLESYNESDENLTENWNALIASSNHSLKLYKEDFRNALFNCFSQNEELFIVSKELSEKPIMDFGQLALLLFNSQGENENKALSAVMHIGMLAKENAGSYPLIPCRYHIIANSINGLCVGLDDRELDRRSKEGWTDLKDFRIHDDPETGKPYFRLYTCRRCGQPYIEAFYNDSTGVLSNKKYSENSEFLERVVFLLGSIHNFIDSNGEEELEREGKEEWVIDSVTWKRLKDDNSKGIKLVKAHLKKDAEERVTYVSKCYNCGSSAKGDVAEILIGFHPGNEALGAVVTHKVIEAVSATTSSKGKPLQGRKLLTFSDNRQDAAYFAPFFQRTSNEIAVRSAIANTIVNVKNSIKFKELIYEIKTYLNKNDAFVIFDENGQLIEGQKKEEALSSLVAAELCTPINRKVSIESLGIIKAEYEGAEQIAKDLQDYIPDKNKKDSLNIINSCLDTMRLNKAISKVHINMDMTDDFFWGVHNYNSSFQQYKTDKRVKFGFMPKENSINNNSRSMFLEKRLGWDRNETMEFLCHLWEALGKYKILINAETSGYVINSDKILYRNAEALKFGFCETCNAHDYYDIEGKCTVYGCNGKVKYYDISERMNSMSSHHYSSLYHEKHFLLRAEEHTAALSNSKRQKIEEEFAEANINLLSCTTTMEMGVDLGDLEAVVCLNIPPGISNYQQRTGRAGRRAQAAPFCVTIAKNSLYDQDVYNNFEHYLNQNIRDMFVHLGNPVLFRRHQYSILLNYYLNEHIHDKSKNAPSIKDLFGKEFDSTGYNNKINAWLESETGKKALFEALEFQTHGIPQYLCITDTTLKQIFTERFMSFYSEVSEKIQNYNEWRKKAREEDNDSLAAMWSRRIDDYLDQFLVNQLSKYGLIPTYSFPIDSITLDILSEKKKYSDGNSDISLARDASLAISEYAPGSDIVAAGKIWTSRGIMISKKDNIHEIYYYLCENCQNVDMSENKNALPSHCKSCGEKHKRWMKFIEPKTFVTSYEDKSGKNTSIHRKRRIYSDEAKLVSLAHDDLFKPTEHNSVVKALLSGREGIEHGRLFVVNSGSYSMGYHRCPLCNYMVPARQLKEESESHKNIFTGRDCSNNKLSFPVNLAHIFETDVMIMKINNFPISSNAKKLARTITEAAKFGIVKLLNLSSNEIRTTYRLKPHSIEIIFYDSVAGGAGYSAKLFEKSVKDIFEYIIKQLTCPDDCENGCRSCLCDYTNQLYWDIFERKDALKFIKALAQDFDSSNLFISLGASIWYNKNLASFAEKLTGVSEVNFFCKSLFQPSDFQNDINNVKAWLVNIINNAGKTNIFIRGHDRNNVNTLSLSMIKYLQTFVEDKRLNIFRLSDNCLELLPFVFSGGSMYYHNVSGSLYDMLNSLTSSCMYTKEADDEIGSLVNNLISISYKLSSDDLYQQMSIRSIKEGYQINFIQLFEEVVGKEIYKIRIEDPYCGAGYKNIETFENFINEYLKLVNSVENIEIITKEQHWNVPHCIDKQTMNFELQRIIKNKFAGKVRIDIKPFNSGLHDRKIECSLSGGSAALKQVIYNLPGGIDRLMRKLSSEIFVVKIT